MQPGLFPVPVLLNKPTLKSSTSVRHFLSKNNKVHVKLAITHKGCLCAFLRCISRAPATSKMEFFMTLLNSFQALTNVTKNHILDVEEVLDPSLLLYIKNNVTQHLYLTYY